MKNVPVKFKSAIAIGISLLLLTVACSLPEPSTPDTPVMPAPSSVNQASFQRQVQTKPYTGSRAAVIFTIKGAIAGVNDNLIEKIIRIFGENNAPVEVSIIAEKQGKPSYQAAYLRDYLNAGVVDLNLLLNADTLSAGGQELIERLKNYQEQFKNYFDFSLITCAISSELNSHDNCSPVQSAGFKVIAAYDVKNNEKVFNKYNCDGIADENGMYFLPIVGNVAEFDSAGNKWGDIAQPDNNSRLITAINNSLDTQGIAVVEISPEAFLTADGAIDSAKLDKLNKLIVFTKGTSEITTFNSWFKYDDKWRIVNSNARKADTPAYDGGPAIIFRIDDCLKDWQEDTVERIVMMFQKNGMSVDCGVIPYNDGEESFDVQMLRKYLDAGVIDITMHGYDWTWAQIDTEKSGVPYQQLVNSLKASKAKIENYYGEEIVSFTVPNDFFNESGYDAIKNAGFKIFSTQIAVEPHPSLIPVDYFGKPDKNGLYRLPTATDATMWDDVKQEWGAVFDVTKFTGLKYYPVMPQYSYVREEVDQTFYSDFYVMVTKQLETMGIAVVSIHPDGFITKNNKPDDKKLAQLEKLIQWCKEYTDNTTFKQWYRYTTSKK